MAINTDSTDKYPFLHTHVAKEPHVAEVLDEIAQYQREVIRNGSGRLATLDSLKDSRNIKMPITPVRGKNILYILETLSTNYPEDVCKLYSYRFIADPDTKKLNIEEETEFTVLCSLADLKKLQDDRDQSSLSSLHELLGKFRLFNLTKLINKAKNRTHLAKIIKGDLGINIFTFKHYTLDKNNQETAEDYCFHTNNYDQVRKSVQSEEIRKILSSYTAQVSRRLQKFGILSADFSDYRDTKVDYLMNILLEDMPTTLTPKDLAEVKNFNALRACLMKVEKILDPLVTLGSDLAKHIRENGITRFRDVISMYDSLTEEMLNSWLKESSFKNKIIRHGSGSDSFLIDGSAFLKMLTDHHTKILYHQDEFANLSQFERQSLVETFEMLCEAGKNLLNYEDMVQAVLSAEDAVPRLKKILKEFEDHKKRQTLKESLESEQAVKKENKSFFAAVIGFFQSLFGGKPKGGKKPSAETTSSREQRRPITRDARDIILKVKENRGKILALSSFLELSDENSFQIDSIIDELRNRNMKTVIPLYNARKSLYPQRSRKYLIADVEYIMIDPDIIQSPESIRGFTDSLAREKLRDEPIPPSAIMTIERYLLTLYRQKRAQMKRKDGKDQKKEEEE